MNWMLYLKTTETCNLNCKHCYTNGTSGPKIYWDTTKVSSWLNRFSQYISPEDTVHCEFHGGEPFLVDPQEMRRVYDSVKFKNASWGITSNLVLKLTEDHFSFIKECLGNRIGTSWDPKIRFGNEKQRELWESNVRELISRGVTVKLFISVTKDTLEFDPIELLSWVKDLGVHELAFERLTGNGNANLFPDIFPKNIEQDKWFLEMHRQSTKYDARGWFDNEFLETIYDKFETGFIGGGTFCRDCEEKIFTLNADGSIAGCPNSAPEQKFGRIEQSIPELINNPIRIDNIACERSRNPLCYSCEVFQYCGGDCHQLSWQDDICGAPKSLMKELSSNNRKTIWISKEY